MNKSDSIIKLTAALAKFQSEVKNPPNSANNPFFKSKYAPLDVVINTAKELLGKHGLSYIQMPGGDGDKVTCVTILMCEGEWVESDILILKADKVTAQGTGSAITYARRYQLSAMLGLAGEEDDDGNNATGNKKDGKQTKEELEAEKLKTMPIDATKVKVINDLIKKSNSDLKRFLTWAKVSKVEEIMNVNFASVTKTLNEALEKYEKVNKKNVLEEII